MAHTVDRELEDRFALVFDRETFRRRIAGTDVILHCHHYNARVQQTVETATAIDGKGIVVSAAEEAFAGSLAGAIRPEDDEATRWEVASRLYAHLGFGRLDLGRRSEGVVEAPESHFVAGWRAGFPSRQTPVCSVTEGYLQAAWSIARGEAVRVREEACMMGGAAVCRFRVERGRGKAPPTRPRRPVAAAGSLPGELLSSSSVDAGRIVDVLAEMPIYGNARGLIPAFNVYLACTPTDFYNLVSIRFVEEMERVDLGAVARRQLVQAAETCGLNTFRGIMASAEWDALVAPMIRERSDNLFGILAVSNGLGWGSWRVAAHEPGESLRLLCANGYEASGMLEHRGPTSRPACLMLTGVAAGIMGLVYGEGTVQERLGTFLSREPACRCTGHEACRFEVEAA